MTIGGWIGFVLGGLFILVIGICVCYTCIEGDHAVGAVLSIAVAITLIIASYVGLTAYYRNTASGQRAMRDFESNISNGVYRTIRQIDDDGKILFEFEGKCDIETDHDEGYILWDDEQGKRHVLYKSATTSIIIEDKSL